MVQENNYLYEIKISNEMEKYMLSFSETGTPDFNNKLPMFFISEKKNLYVVIHGSVEGNLIINGEEYTIGNINEFYKSLVLMLSMTYKIKSKNVYLINCYGGRTIEMYDPLGIGIKSVFKTFDPLFVKTTNKNTFEIATTEEVRIPEELKDDIKFLGKLTPESNIKEKE